MKKVLSVITIITIAFCICACNDDNNVSKVARQIGVSRVINNSKNINDTINIPLKTFENPKIYKTVGASPLFIGLQPTLKGMTEVSDVVVSGKVLSVGYATEGPSVYTLCDIKIENSLKGKYNTGDIITIIKYGGYMTLKEAIEADDMEVRFKDVSEEEREKRIIKKGFIEDKLPDPKIGDDNLLFLKLETEGKFKGGYSPHCCYYGRYLLKDGYYIRTGDEGKAAKPYNKLDPEKAFEQIKEYVNQ